LNISILHDATFPTAYRSPVIKHSDVLASVRLSSLASRMLANEPFGMSSVTMAMGSGGDVQPINRTTFGCMRFLQGWVIIS
jgi:hypothetical protein